MYSQDLYSSKAPGPDGGRGNFYCVSFIFPEEEEQEKFYLCTKEKTYIAFISFTNHVQITLKNETQTKIQGPVQCFIFHCIAAQS